MLLISAAGAIFILKRVVHACMLTRNCIETMYLATDYGVRDRFIFRPIFQNAISFLFFSLSHSFHSLCVCVCVMCLTWENSAKFKRNSTVMCHFHLVQHQIQKKRNVPEKERKKNKFLKLQVFVCAAHSRGAVHIRHGHKTDADATDRDSRERDTFRLCKCKWSAIDHNRLAITF